MTSNSFIHDLKRIKENARKNLSKGPVTDNYKLDLPLLLKLLNDALATEIVCTLRYKKHHYKATTLGASIAATEFLEHANQESAHADSLSGRILQLGGEPNLNPATLLSCSHADYVDCDTVADMIKENLIAERIAIDIYRDMINFVGNADPTTRVLLEGILATEEEHADDLLDMAAEYKIALN